MESYGAAEFQSGWDDWRPTTVSLACVLSAPRMPRKLLVTLDGPLVAADVGGVRLGAACSIPQSVGRSRGPEISTEAIHP
jgi:hypothetical protein